MHPIPFPVHSGMAMLDSKGRYIF